MSEKWIYKIDDLKMDNEALLVNETIFHNMEIRMDMLKSHL